jgi:adenylate cyclase
VVQLLLRADEEDVLDCNEKEVTIFFSDIASFTTILEGLSPQSSLLLLSRYFHDMSKITDDYGGIVLEFIGDAILSVYGAPINNPKHATVAVKSAVKMLEALVAMNEWCERHDLPTLSIRCGIHTGRVLVGNMGFNSRMKYGVVGQESEIPKTLEELNKTYGTECLISSRAYDMLHKELFIVRPVDYVHLSTEKGAPSELIYNIMSRYGVRKDKDVQKRALAKLHAAAMEHYRLRNFKEAARLFRQVRESMQQLSGEEDMPSSLLLRRCLFYIDQPSPPEWDGVWDATNDLSKYVL